MCVHVCASFELFVGLIKLVNHFFVFFVFKKKKKNQKKKEEKFKFFFKIKNFKKICKIFSKKKSEFSVRFSYINSQKKKNK